MQSEDEQKKLSVKDVAKIVGVSEEKVRKDTKLGLLETRFKGTKKYHPHDVDAWEKGRRPNRTKKVL